MRLTRLNITNLRALRQTEIEFDEAFTLLIGVNGVGKSTVLDALRTTLSMVWSELGIYKRGTLSFTKRDITINQLTMEVELAFEIAGQNCALSVVEQRFNDPDNPEWQGEFTGEEAPTLHVPDVRRLGVDPRLPIEVDDPDGLRCSARTLKERLKHRWDEKPLAMYYSTRRSLFREWKASQAVLKNTASAPYVQALDHRALQVVELATWWKKEKYLATRFENERARQAGRHIAALKRTGMAIVEGLTDLDVKATEDDDLTKRDLEGDEPTVWVPEGEPTLEATKDGLPIDVRILSDGERSLLSLALDITRRLAQAYPHLDDPADKGHAVILIDELDLHLHPRWQREIVGRLRSTFPECQFICTTHSPFVIQSLREGSVVDMDDDEVTAPEMYEDQSIEDIAEDVMEVDVPQKSKRYLDMMQAAEEYFRLLKSVEGAPPDEVVAAKDRLDELSSRYSDDPAYQALLKVEREARLDS